MTPASISLRSRRRAAAALAAVVVGAVALLVPLRSGVSAAAGVPAVVGALAAPVSTTAGTIALAVDPAAGLTTAGATLKVTGRGYDPATGIYVAICRADGKAPGSLKDCVGGAILNGNNGRSWAHVSNTATSSAGGAVVARWGSGGSFSIELALPASDPSSDALDCAKASCAVYTVADAGQRTSENLSIPLVYGASGSSGSSAVTTSSAAASSAVSSSEPVSSAPASSSPQFSTSSAVVPTTVQAKSVRSPDVVAGGAQEVLFAGFTKNEPVTVTLYSAPQSLPATRADQDGVVKVDFTVPANLQPGTHLLRVVGQLSKVTGVASFVVTAPVAPSSAVVVASSPATSSAAPSSAPASSAVPVPAPLSSAAVAASVPPVSSAAAPIVPPASSGKVVWPWYALGALLAVLAGVIAYLLNRRFRLAVERRENEAMLADAAAAEHERNLDAIARANADAPTSYLGGAGTPIAPPAGGYAGYHPGEHGLLSGRDQPDNPGLLSGTGYLPPADRPTTYLSDDRTTQLPGDRTRFPAGDDRTAFRSEPGTSGSAPGREVVGDPAAGGPPTSAWRPDFDDPAGPHPAGPNPAGPNPPGPESDGPDGGAAGGRHSRPN